MCFKEVLPNQREVQSQSKEFIFLQSDSGWQQTLVSPYKISFQSLFGTDNTVSDCSPDVLKFDVIVLLHTLQ